MHRPVKPGGPALSAALATLSRARVIEAYLPPPPPAGPAAFADDLVLLVKESLVAAEIPARPGAPADGAFARHPVPPKVVGRAPVPAAPAPATPKQRRDRELVEALLRRSRVSRRLSGAPIIKSPIIPKEVP